MNTEFPTYFSSKHALSMELRDYFAIKILQSLIPVDNQHNPDSWDFRLSMDDAYQMADAMMEARKEKK